MFRISGHFEFAFCFGMNIVLCHKSSERLAEFLRSCGLSLSEQRTLGQETEGERAWGGFAVAIVM